MAIHFSRICVLGSICIALLLPLVAAGQSGDLSATIRAEILKDPRSASVPPAQMDAMVAALAEAAVAQGVTAEDITWRANDVNAQSSECDFLCSINAIFGFSGDDYSVALGLGITSALLILFLSMMFHRHHKHGGEPTVDAIRHDGL